MEIKVYGNNVEQALKAFKRQYLKEGLSREIKRRRFYEKPSEKKRRKQREIERKRAKAQRFKTLQ
jgi:small subunit ribosomal protein S21